LKTFHSQLFLLVSSCFFQKGPKGYLNHAYGHFLHKKGESWTA